MAAAKGCRPTHRRVKARKVVEGTRRLTERFDAWRSGRISFADFDASVGGWINHVRYADTWGLRRSVLRAPIPKDGASQNCGVLPEPHTSTCSVC